MKAIILSLALLPAAVLAGEKINKEIDIEQDGKVFIENQRGNVVIKTWDKGKFKVEGELDEAAKGFKLVNNGSKTEFIVEMPSRVKGWGRQHEGSELTIFMPRQSELVFEGVQVDIEVSQLLAGAFIKTVNGDIKASQIEGKVRLETVNGNIDGKDLSGRVRYETVNGDIEDMGSAGKLRFNAVNGSIESNTSAKEIRLENVNGEVEFEIAELQELRLNTVNGEIEIRTKKLLPNARMNLESVSGDVDLYFPKDLSARFDIDAHAGGKIINELSSDKVKKAKYGPSRELEFSIAGGDADVEIDTVSGRIALKKN
ncbi:DUF4097 family beta strand repeat-containing protein [Pseudoalteromonas luteoviolacea]|uniref:DUF4097 domain-containing protein n=1 Tax=Pseudoalteromonas luteoviolacea DSM 6061 TaxID=1365250 RepID=A0A166XBQ2_9GAMM|nr:DUF4097 family beta strand repeat-containing protein [Pseudoalteromonas luteoviolacea]KZN39976.1 hypothetical protein N475_12945 [Pseudoalteromonas luteoviolacea DSM 6061]KZN56758.1 hypothetical protein N474_10560 [Pseudoalteromonas luteoviolacea CPMOR-2]MBE0388242.1 hypothetical protein [Pseudoalteromonas luteoviolacea DSM 6061]TQF72912.1 DUF4097 family beta strand repeat protein [Pseudoalteromonas luteoviolacea]